MDGENSKSAFPQTKMRFLVTVGSAQAFFTEVCRPAEGAGTADSRQETPGAHAPVNTIGSIIYNTIVLKMGYTSSEELKTWMLDCVSKGVTQECRRHITIELLDDWNGSAYPVEKTVNREMDSHGSLWILKNALVINYSAPALLADGKGTEIESMEISYEEISSPNQEKKDS